MASVWLRGAVFIPLVLLLSRPSLVAAGAEEDSTLSLAADDECSAAAAGGSSQSECAVSALQLRAKRESALLNGTLESASAAAAAASYFERRVEASKLTAELNVDELLRYRQRFLDSVELAVQAGDAIAEEDLSTWFFDQGPAISEKIYDHILNKAVEWKARMPSWAKDLSLKDVKTLMGMKKDDNLEELKEPSIQPKDAKGMPLDFDSRQKWPHCTTAFTHVRDQGHCGSCWAFAAANTMDGRLCIATKGEFSGPRAWTSAAYFTSCYNKRSGTQATNGCDGGNPGSALQAAARGAFGSGGVPTGSPAQNTCVPWFGYGSALEHFTGRQIQAPPCPTHCTSKDYPRPLQKDRFFPTGKVQRSSNIVDLQRALIEGGPLPFALTVYQDFMTYQSGWYSPTTKQKVGDHAATAIGYATHQGSTYVVGMNSWGHSWGDGTGIFKMESQCCNLQYYFPQIDGDQESLPLPGSRPGEGLFGGSCRTRTGGTCLLKACYQSRGPTTCEWGHCMCKPGFCVEAGMCVAAKTVADATGVKNASAT